MPFRVSSSSAALAAVTRSQVVSRAAMARSPRYSWACRMMSYRAIMDFRSPWNIRCTSEVSAPARRRYAAASKVRPPVRLVKFLVSSTMPASRASASHLRMSPGSTRYCSSSVTSSEADEA